LVQKLEPSSCQQVEAGQAVGAPPLQGGVAGSAFRVQTHLTKLQMSVMIPSALRPAPL
jgi:hypothetical protein